MPPTQSRPEVETLQRARRIETRLTTLMIGLGIETGAQKPVYDQATRQLDVLSLHVSLKEILDSLPQSSAEPISLVIGGRRVASLVVAASAC